MYLTKCFYQEPRNQVTIGFLTDLMAHERSSSLFIFIRGIYLSTISLPPPAWNHPKRKIYLSFLIGSHPFERQFPHVPCVYSLHSSASRLTSMVFWRQTRLHVCFQNTIPYIHTYSHTHTHIYVYVHLFLKGNYVSCKLHNENNQCE